MTTLDHASGASRLQSAAPWGQPLGRTTLSRSLSARTEDVDSDLASLAAHMDHCARAHGRPTRAQGLAGLAHALASPRIVTVIALVGLLAVAMVSLCLGIAQVI